MREEICFGILVSEHKAYLFLKKAQFSSFSRIAPEHEKSEEDNWLPSRLNFSKSTLIINVKYCYHQIT